ncbi:hypothetical protein GCM10023215_67140 [Pseudonocardia yuanmonensis]|uniref:Uncharacterized protein n=1 Tax=Pseudonocardia yuanmonensis TaxID=1095914 RepID=A0ABP8XTV2_9PSEU
MLIEAGFDPAPVHQRTVELEGEKYHLVGEDGDPAPWYRRLAEARIASIVTQGREGVNDRQY